MATIPAATKRRLVSAVPKFKKILQRAAERDVNESDTVTIVTDILEEVFGFDKYSDITREYAIQGTYCDLAIKTDKKVDYLIEVKAVGISLKDTHLRQAINYAAQEGIRWIVLTNGLNWEVHRVSVENRVDSSKLIEFVFTDINPRKNDDQELLFLLCKRGLKKDLIDDFYEYRQSVNRYTTAAILLSDPVISVVRRELRRIKSGLKVSNEQVEDLLLNEVLKRDVVESDPAIEAKKAVQKALKKKLRAKTSHKRSKDAANALDDTGNQQLTDPARGYT